MTIQVGDIKKAQNQVSDILKKNNAYIQTEQFQNTDLDDNLILSSACLIKISMLW